MAAVSSHRSLLAAAYNMSMSSKTAQAQDYKHTYHQSANSRRDARPAAAPAAVPPAVSAVLENAQLVT
jgi:hypothetical protein